MLARLAFTRADFNMQLLSGARANKNYHYHKPIRKGEGEGKWPQGSSARGQLGPRKPTEEQVVARK